MVLRAFCRKSCQVRSNYRIINRVLRACNYDPVRLVDVARTRESGLVHSIWTRRHRIRQCQPTRSYLYQAGVQPVKVEPGASQALPASITEQEGGPVYLNVYTNGQRRAIGSPP